MALGAFLFTLSSTLEKLGPNPESVAQYAQRSLWGFDIDERQFRIARALMVVAGDGSTNIFRLNSLITKRLQGSLLPSDAADLMMTIEDAVHPRLKGKELFDVILTNPPFAGEIRERDLLSSYDNGRGKSRVERDVLFLERCVSLLRPGGRMAIVLPHNKLSSSFFQELRVWVMDKCVITGVVSLGRNVFMPHTQQKTGVVILRKKRKLSEINTKPVFLATSERDGKDKRGNHILKKGADLQMPLWERLDHDLEEIVTEFRSAA